MSRLAHTACSVQRVEHKCSNSPNLSLPRYRTSPTSFQRSAELLGVLAGTEAEDKYDGNDPVSGRVVFMVNGTEEVMTVSFQINARIIRKTGVFNEDGSPSVQVTDEGVTIPVQVDNEPGRFINVISMSSGSMVRMES